MDPEEPAILYNVACAYALLGERDRSIDCLANTTLGSIRLTELSAQTSRKVAPAAI